MTAKYLYTWSQFLRPIRKLFEIPVCVVAVSPQRPGVESDNYDLL